MAPRSPPQLVSDLRSTPTRSGRAAFGSMPQLAAIKSLPVGGGALGSHPPHRRSDPGPSECSWASSHQTHLGLLCFNVLASNDLLTRDDFGDFIGTFVQRKEAPPCWHWGCSFAGMADSSLTRWHDGGYRTWIKSARSSTIIASKSSLTCAQHPHTILR